MILFNKSMNDTFFERMSKLFKKREEISYSKLVVEDVV